MLKNLILTFFLLFSSYLTIYPSKKENTNLVDYCYSLEKIISRNLLEKNTNFSENYKTLARDIILFGSYKTKGSLVNRIIDQYKNSRKLFIITLVPNRFFCLAGYWVEQVNPGTFQSIFYEKSKERINQYKNIKEEVNLFFNDINSEYKSLKKEFIDFF